ncbi:MAG: PH domain-containing protein [Jatrophihabitantaceae bacterium]
MDQDPNAVTDEAARRRPHVQFAPDLRLSVALALAGLLCAGASIATDAAGRLLLIAAALMLLGIAACDLIFRPRLQADADGVTIRSPMQRTHLGWDQIEQVRADVRTRHGLRSVSLEIDTGDDLVVLSRRGLGTDPERVAALVNAFAPSR